MTHAHRLVLKCARTLHVYLTLFGFVLLLFFAATGFMLNHEDWFSPKEPFEFKHEGTLPPELLARDDHLAIVELLRSDFGARGKCEYCRYEEEMGSYRARFESPGYFAEATIQKEDGKTLVEHKTYGIAGVLLDLHRGKTSGPEWKLVIDGVSILFVLISITGLILWSSLRARAQHGLTVLMLGLALGLAVYFVYVPR